MHFWVATRKGLFRVERGARGWRIAATHFLADNCTAVAEDPRDGSVLVALSHGHFGCKLHRAEAGGAFEEVAVPVYPPLPEGEPELEDMMGRKIPSSLELIWCLEPGHRERPGEYWCGTIPGGLFHSSDGGRDWSLVRPLWDVPERKRWFGGGADYPGIHSVWLPPDRPDEVVAAVSCGGVWISEDAGASFRAHGEGLRAVYVPAELAGDPAVQDPHRVVGCAGDTSRLWMQHHNGIFRSDDGGRRWTEIDLVSPSPSVFGFAVAVHPTDPDTAWFVPAIKDERRIPVDGRLVVTRTRDAGVSFEVLGRGLPAEHAYHLVFRHALDVDVGGEVLAFGSTTGSLWISEDAGDSWQRLSAELPPVHAVRFGGAG